MNPRKLTEYSLAIAVSKCTCLTPSDVLAGIANILTRFLGRLDDAARKSIRDNEQLTAITSITITTTISFIALTKSLYFESCYYPYYYSLLVVISTSTTYMASITLKTSVAKA